MQVLVILILALCLFPLTDSACVISGGQDSNIGIGVYIDQSGYCYPGQSFVVPLGTFTITDVEVLISGSNWYIELLDDFGGKVLGTSSRGYDAGYNNFARVTFSPPVSVIPGKTVVVKPRGTGTWYINQNDYFKSGRLAGTGASNYAGQCWGSSWDSAFRVNCGTPDLTTPWTCIPGIDCPMRKNKAGDIECMSGNGRDCLWTSGQCGVTLASPPASIVPLTCGAGHMSVWGSWGYDNPIHWCYKAWEYYQPWYCLPGLTSPMRLNSQGNPECYSNNGRDCAWGSVSCTTQQVYTPPAGATINPLVCGKGHLGVWGSIGYDNPVHWCVLTVQTLEPTCIQNSNTVVYCNPATGAQCTGNVPCPLINS